ncbi:hypothetical protein D9X30_3254 [Cupriavidus sp. U2]|uniref:hypothetical protein n=1 Tax=Cupriavidus sp. U2 TaxID=2920269 RepID=UPI00129D3942|nr:hypothetical protein [Cupriavidus sp. U2]KAI3591729.1 hypothetical protein D9X30_3254 [Cupriavidus sp. U2]
MANFHAWWVSPLRHGATANVVAGRLQAGATVTLEEIVVGAPRTVTAPAPYELFGPGDVQRLAPGVITRRFPSPGAVDAEDTKRALVEFSHDDTLDLPWRYSPDAGLPGSIRPWLVLVVGKPADVMPGLDGRVTLSATAQSDHPLNRSHRWAHVHEVDGTRYSRVLSPKLFEAKTAYNAVLVPAWIVEPDGTLRDAWPLNGGPPVRLPCYDQWGFRTGEDGDFGDLARRLRTPAASELKETFGRAALHYQRRGQPAPGEPASVTLATGGALQRVTTAGTAPAPVDAWLAAETAALASVLPAPGGRWILTSPIYHAPFTAPGTPAAAGWSRQFLTDPRHRGTAGLGAWAGIAWQDRIAAAAATRAGDLAIARERVGNVALGVEVSRSLWVRRMPADDIDKLAVLSAMLGRMPASDQQTVSMALDGRTPGMSPAIWSSAARRALRPGPARSAWTRDGVIPWRWLLEAAAACPDDPDDPDNPDDVWGAPRTGDPAKVVGEALRRALRDDDEADAFLRQLTQSGALASLDRLAGVFNALTPDVNGNIDRERLLRVLRKPPDLIDVQSVGPWIERIGGTRLPCQPVDLGKLGGRIADAVDPFAERPPAVIRVLGTLPGIADIGPIEIEPELDLPLWQFLRDAQPDWLLPGVGDLKPDRVLGLATHPAFVEAFLVGANQQALGELRWRNMPIGTRWSPLRKFWQRASGEMDILPIKGWPVGTELGGAGLAPAGLDTEAVVLFRTPLFRRYPATVVYLYRNTDGWKVPDPDTALDEGRKSFPTFAGRIGDDVTFFGFGLAPAELANHWVVLEEPPAGYRFYGMHLGQVMPPGDPPNPGDGDGATWGSGTFAPPVRVMIGKLELA